MLRLMCMGRVARVATLVVVMLPAACTASSDNTATKGAVPPTQSASVADTSERDCAAKYPETTVAESSVAGDLRFFGPRPVNATGNFADLPDDARVALCLVPDGKGLFAVYGVPEATGRGRQLWTQSDGQKFTRPV